MTTVASTLLTLPVTTRDHIRGPASAPSLSFYTATTHAPNATRPVPW
jgi:hypothetical protein